MHVHHRIGWNTMNLRNLFIFTVIYALSKIYYETQGMDYTPMIKYFVIECLASLYRYYTSL